MTTLLHISDLHFGTEKPDVVQAVVALAHHKKPDMLIVSGDITQRATPGQFNSARDFCERLGDEIKMPKRDAPDASHHRTALLPA